MTVLVLLFLKERCLDGYVFAAFDAIQEMDENCMTIKFLSISKNFPKPSYKENEY